VITKQTPNAPAGPAYRLSSVDHALELLLLFRTKPALRVAEVAEQLGVARSTAHRLLGMLVHRQFAVQDPATRAYRPGPRLMEIGLAAVGALDVRVRMRPHLSEIAAHATSAGKAMLAVLTTDEVLAIYPNEKLATVTEHTLATRTQLLAELDQVRGSAFAVNFGESETGLGAIGMAVLDADGRPAAGFTVAGPMQRMTQEYVQALARELRPVVAEATAELLQVGYF
jgi:DNA-binding IclR family transcriptional regulator